MFRTNFSFIAKISSI